MKLKDVLSVIYNETYIVVGRVNQIIIPAQGYVKENADLSEFSKYLNDEVIEIEFSVDEYPNEHSFSSWVDIVTKESED